MKVLASYPDGRATLSALKADLAILAGAGQLWRDRLKRLASVAPDLDIFGQALVVRDDRGWQITSAGRNQLQAIEMPAAGRPMLESEPQVIELQSVVVPVAPSVEPVPIVPPSNVHAPAIANVGRHDTRRRRRRQATLPRSA